MILEIEEKSSIAPFEQIANQLRAGILAGQLDEGSQLPTVRQLAYDLDVAPNTVMRAYTILAEEGFLELRGRKGTIVSGQWRERRQGKDVEADLERLLEHFIRSAERAGKTPAEIIRLVKEKMENG